MDNALTSTYGTTDGAPTEQPYHATLLTEIQDMARGVVHGGIEDPINGAVQFANHELGTTLPQLHLVDEQKANRSYGGEIGTALGKIADVAGLTMATLGTGTGLGMVAIGARLGVAGAVYGGILTPTDENSTSFTEDRI